jgi:membrane-associated phospholipid phosphatase
VTALPEAVGPRPLISPLRRPGPLVAVALAYLGLATGVMIWRGISVSPDYLLFLMVPVALLSGRFLRFVGDWVPFVAIFLGWEAMRGIAPQTGFLPHVGDLAAAETWLFGGHLPTASLQGWIDHGAGGTVVDYAGTVVYFCHFAVPLAIGLVLWLVDRTQFLRFTVALMGMAFVAFVVFLLLPTAPPWYAQDHGFISGFHKIIGTTLPSSISPYYNSLNPNPVAAMPSLHAAFPFLGFLALRRVYPRAAWVALGWSMLVWFSVVYLGEHYAIDVFAGILMAGLSWAVLMRVAVPRVRALQPSVEPAGALQDDVGVPLEQEAVA